MSSIPGSTSTIISNSVSVKSAFLHSEVASGDELTFNNPEVHTTLDVVWSIKDDVFAVRTNVSEHPFTMQAILAVINGVYDAIWVVGPVVLGGNLIQRPILSPKDFETLAYDWDNELPDSHLPTCKHWNLFRSYEVSNHPFAKFSLVSILKIFSFSGVVF